MAQVVGSSWLVLAAWVVAGLLSMAGALTYAELGALLPEAGGEYVFLRRAYGIVPAFFFGWTRFSVVSTGSIAVMSVGFATFLSAALSLNRVWAHYTFRLLGQDVHWQFGSSQVVAVASIAVLSALNCAGIAFGGRVQSVITIMKTLGVATIVAGVFGWSRSASWGNFAASSGTAPVSTLSSFGTAMLAALWAYEGWNTMPMVAGEIRDPGRSVPRALVLGMLSVITIYLVANLAYFYSLPFSEVATSNSTSYRDALPVATKAVRTFLGPFGEKLVSVAFILSALGAVNGLILSSARVPFAMARDGMFFSRMSMLNNSHVPVWSILIQAIWASVLAISGSYDQVSDCVIFASWIFYGMTATAVLVLRVKMPLAVRPYRTPGYPLVPIAFVALAAWLVVNTLITRPIESAAGLVLIALGLPVFIYYRCRRQKNEIREQTPRQ